MGVSLLLRPSLPARGQRWRGRSKRVHVGRTLGRSPCATRRFARDLNIGRPDLSRDYDDGGLIDLNGAPASVLASACGFDPAVAERLTDARELFPAGFSSIDEALVYAELAGRDADVLRDRAVVLTRWSG